MCAVAVLGSRRTVADALYVTIHIITVIFALARRSDDRSGPRRGEGHRRSGSKASWVPRDWTW